ncbi:hypothetical protein BCR43DRAFT_498540 [Syncephalastrum racemosum]|uniref:Uncharacterized protein n=1 Tax=Syncephalastrum racemosum TaxID=13706 RepID=A0A1X2H177_SYNRA|nr:hypothetical protein BCR43DRAFT_498540 [Syncephalastrum racemosum]
MRHSFAFIYKSTPAPAQTHSIPYNPITDSFQEQQQRRQPQLHLDSPRSLPRALLPPQTTSQAHNTSPSSPSRSHFTSDIPHISQPLSTPPVQPPAPPTLPAFRSVNNPSQRELALNRAIDQCNQLCAELRRQFDFPAADTRLASLELFTQTGFGEHPATRELPLDVTAGVPMSSNRSSSHTSNQASALHVRQGMVGI